MSSRSCQFIVLAVLLSVAATSGNGAIWESTAWILSPSLTSRVGYDSNIMARADGSGDGFAEIEPTLRLARRPSLTLLSIEASANIVTFADSSDQNSIDPALRVKYRYPYEEGVRTTSEMDAWVSRTNVANPDVGRRVRETDFSFRWEATVASTAKTQLQARLSARRLSYRERDLNTNDTADAGLTLGCISNEKLELGAGYDLSLSRSTPAAATKAKAQRIENAVTIRGRGEFSPNLSGRFYFGLADASYSGAQRRSEVDFVAGANIGWAVRERLHLTALADRRVYFSPEGDAAQETSLGVDLSQEIAGGFTATLGAQGIRTVYRRTIVYRHDNSFPLRAKLDYMINQRFTAALEFSWSAQNSDMEFRNYQRTTIAARLQYRF